MRTRSFKHVVSVTLSFDSLSTLAAEPEASADSPPKSSLLFSTEHNPPLLCTVLIKVRPLQERLNAAHHGGQRSMLDVSWKDKVATNEEEVRARTEQQSMDIGQHTERKKTSLAWTRDTNRSPM